MCKCNPRIKTFYCGVGDCVYPNPIIQEKESINLEDLERTIDRVKSLLQDKQPGLMSWNQFLHDNLKELQKMLRAL